MEIRVKTEQLRKLLEENPEAKLALDSMACEKIAQELHRKALEVYSGKFVEDTTRRVTAQINEAMRSQWSFPDAGKKAVEVIVKAYVETALREKQNEILAGASKRIEEMMNMAKAALDRRFEAKYVDFQKWAEAEVRRIAREEFIKTLETVRSFG